MFNQPKDNMLCITRKPREKIKLSCGVVISIEGIQGTRVKIGIEAPNDIEINRSEPCQGCLKPCFGFYLDYKDIPFCGSDECEEIIRDENKSLFP